MATDHTKEPQVELTCAHCSSKFMRSVWTHQSAIKRGRKNTFCTIECSREFNRKKNRKPLFQLKDPTYDERAIRQFCPSCGEKGIIALETKKNKFGHIYRRKGCVKCDHRYTTFEISAEDYNFYVKGKGHAVIAAQTKKCPGCKHNTGSRCDLDLPEYGTLDSFDCIHYD